VTGPGIPALPYQAGDRQQFFAELLAALVRTDTADGQPFGLRTRALDDPTVALLDAWATVADVIAFYSERIAGEGFLRTATQPGSLLAIAGLVGYQPRPGLAASVWLAYSLHPDPADTAVILPGGLLAQSVPGTGELPQTFETTAQIVARPSWNTLKVRATGPVQAPHGLSAVTSLSFHGATTGLTASDVILLSDGRGKPVPVVVEKVSVDLAAKVTTVTLQGQPPGDAAGAGQAPAVEATGAPAEPARTAGASQTAGPGGATGPPATIIEAMDALTKKLSERPPPPPPSAAALNRGPAEVFAAGSDAVPRLVAALDPAVASTIYKAVSTAEIGSPAVTHADALQVRATPFGVQMPPRPVFDRHGQQTGTQEWPIAGLQTLSASMAWSEHRDDAHGPAEVTITEVTITGPDGSQAQASLVPARRSHDRLTPEEIAEAIGTLGTLHLREQRGSVQLVFTPSAASTGLQEMTVSLAEDQATGAYEVTFSDGSSFRWRPEPGQSQSFTIGNQRVSIEWGQTDTANRSFETGAVTMSVAEALPVPHHRVLDLDTTHPGIVPGSWVVIENAGTAGGDGTVSVAGEEADVGAAGETLTYPLVRQVLKTATVTLARYGMSGTVTQLTLDAHWADPDARWLSALRPITVRAQPARLTLLPVALPGEVAGDTIDLDGLPAGLEAGHRILVTGTRAGLPAEATVPAGEQAMIAGVTQNAGGGARTAYTTLHLAAPLTYTYERASAQVYGNVVPAHQGATVTESLTGSAPGDPHPSFTLSQAPVLADPSPTAAGSASSLRLNVGGRFWKPVTRLDASTPPDTYLTGIDSQGRTTITLSGPLPTGTSSVVATYRIGQGSAGNVRAHQVTQLLSRPLTVAGVDNPLPGSGGSDGDGPDDLRSRAPVGLASLGRLVSVADVADLVLSWAGVGKAHAVQRSFGGAEIVALTVAGVDPAALLPGDELLTSLASALVAAGRPEAPVVVVPAPLYLIVLAARVRCAPAFDWGTVSTALRAALTGAFGYEQRGLGEGIVLSEVVAVAQSVPGVESFTVTAITLIPSTAMASDIAALTAKLPAPPGSGRLPLPRAPAGGDTPPGEAVAYLSDAVTDTLILQRVVH
jgi:predicted phage baseplate assembly protein